MKKLSDFLNEAKAAAPQVGPEAAHGETGLLLDVREADELEKEGAIKDALHIPRGMLEAKADPDSPAKNDRLVAAGLNDETIYICCATGARGALAAHTLTLMGYKACNVTGGFAAWKSGGHPTAKLDS